MKRSILIALGCAIALAPLGMALSGDNSFDHLQAGSITYRIPKEFRAGGDSDGDIFIKVRLSDWGPLERDAPGWEDNVNILITPQPAPIAVIYDHHYDGTPVGTPGKWTEIVRTHREEPDLTVEVMGSVYDIVIPDQDRATMPLGFMRCTRPNPPLLPNASCGLLFDRDGQRWKITFGRQFLHRYSEFRERATTLLDSFRKENQ
jgi:hypothetical protein